MATAPYFISLQPPEMLKKIDDPIAIAAFKQRVEKYRGDCGALPLAQLVAEGAASVVFGELLPAAKERFEVGQPKMDGEGTHTWKTLMQRDEILIQRMMKSAVTEDADIAAMRLCGALHKLRQRRDTLVSYLQYRELFADLEVSICR